MSFVIVVDPSPDPDEQYVIGPFDSREQADAYIEAWADADNQSLSHEYASPWFMNEPDAELLAGVEA